MTVVVENVDARPLDTAPAKVATQRPWLKPAIGIALLLIILFAAPIYGRLTSGGKIDPGIDRSASQVDVTVDLPFAPEAYHRDTLSDLGVFAGRDREDETKLRLRAVTQSDLDRIANLYWVEAIALTERG